MSPETMSLERMNLDSLKDEKQLYQYESDAFQLANCITNKNIFQSIDFQKVGDVKNN